MRRFDRDEPPCSEPEVEALLREFFRLELPSDLPPLPSRRARPATLAFPAHVRWAGAAAAVALVVSAAFWLVRPFPAGTDAANEIALENRPAAKLLGEAPGPPSSPLLTGPGYSVTQHEWSGGTLDAGDTMTAPSNEVRWQSVALYEPHSGEQIKINLPQVTTELPGLTIRVDSQVPASANLKVNRVD